MLPEPLISEFADDPQIRELLAEFTIGLGETCQQLREGVRMGNVEVVRRIGHQLKGAGGGYGYPDLTTAAGRLETAVVSAGAISDEVRRRAGDLIQLCERVQIAKR